MRSGEHGDLAGSHQVRIGVADEPCDPGCLVGLVVGGDQLTCRPSGRFDTSPAGCGPLEHVHAGPHDLW